MLRFFAFLCIFLLHTIHIPKRWSGFSFQVGRAALAGFAFAVPLFFFLSAFLITTLLEIEIESRGRVHLAAFYVRRILRIWPLYFAYYLLGCLLSLTLGARNPEALHLGWPAARDFALFIGNWHILHTNWANVGIFGILWSVCIEEQFYAVCPLVLRYCSKSGVMLVNTTALLVSWVSCVVLQAHHVPNIVFWANTFVHLQFLAAGGLFAFLLRRRKLDLPMALRPLAFLVGLVFWIWPNIPWFATRLHMALFGMLIQYLSILVGCVCIFAAVYALPSALVSRRLVNLGKISYGLYVLHQICVLSILSLLTPLGFGTHTYGHVLMRSLLSFILSLTVASLSYRYLELPFLELKERFTFVRSRPPEISA